MDQCADQRETQTLLTSALHVIADFYGRKSGSKTVKELIWLFFHISLLTSGLMLVHTPAQPELRPGEGLADIKPVLHGQLCRQNRH